MFRCNSPIVSSPTRDEGRKRAFGKIGFRALLAGIVAVLGIGCSPATNQAPIGERADVAEVKADDALVQFSLVAALAAGDYAGGAPLRQVLRGGDFGVGTFSRLDGEMIVLDGKIYQALADGTVRAANLEGTTPFAAVTFFNEDGRSDNFSAATLNDLDEQLDRKLPRRNVPYAIRIDGEFTELTLRSVPAQAAPFPPLVDVVKHQSVRQHRHVRGSLVGLRCPAWMGTLNVSGYHWHFLSDDRSIGGHVFGCELKTGSLRFDECTSIVIQLPQSREFDEFDAEKIQKHDIDAIERQRVPSGRR